MGKERGSSSSICHCCRLKLNVMAWQCERYSFGVANYMGITSHRQQRRRCRLPVALRTVPAERGDGNFDFRRPMIKAQSIKIVCGLGFADNNVRFIC